MAESSMASAFDFDDEFDPLAVDDAEIDQEDMDDDNPLDTVDYPTMRNMPESMQREAVYTPEHQGSVSNAVRELLSYNPGRRPVLLAIIDWCRDGLEASKLSELVDGMQADNRSVYAPMTLCRMLERAGALELEMPEVTEAIEDIDEGVEYLEIAEQVDPVWRATEEGLAVQKEMTEGAVFRDIVLDRDSQYLEVYRAVMEAVAEAPRSKVEIEELVDTFDVVMEPRRFGGHFIDMLERADVFAWKNHAWTLTGLGEAMLNVLREA